MTSTQRRVPAPLPLLLPFTLTSLLLVLVLLFAIMPYAARADCPPGGFVQCVDDKTYIVCGGGRARCQGQKVCDNNTPSMSTSSPCKFYGTCGQHIC